MARSKAFVVSVAVAVTAVVAAGAAIQLVRLGPSPLKAALAPASAVANRQSKLDQLGASLARARRAKPPKLPAVPRFPHVVIPDPVSLPPAAPVQQVSKTVQTTTVQKTTVAPAPVKHPVASQAASPTVTTFVAAPAPPTTTTGSDDSTGGGGSDDGSGGGDDG